MDYIGESGFRLNLGTAGYHCEIRESQESGARYYRPCPLSTGPRDWPPALPLLRLQPTSAGPPHAPDLALSLSRLEVSTAPGCYQPWESDCSHDYPTPHLFLDKLSDLGVAIYFLQGPGLIQRPTLGSSKRVENYRLRMITLRIVFNKLYEAYAAKFIHFKCTTWLVLRHVYIHVTNNTIKKQNLCIKTGIFLMPLCNQSLCSTPQSRKPQLWFLRSCQLPHLSKCVLFIMSQPNGRDKAYNLLNWKPCLHQ